VCSVLRRRSRYRCDNCGKRNTTTFKDGLWRLPKIFAIHINRTRPDGVTAALPSLALAGRPASDCSACTDHKRHCVLSERSQSRCGDPIDFAEEIDVRPMLLYPKFGGIDHDNKACSSE
jgi:hypothetical protein